MKIKMQKATMGYSKLENVREHGIDLTEEEQEVLEGALFRHRKGRAFEELLFLDQREVLYWAVGFGMETGIEVPNLKYLLEIEVLEDIKIRHLNSYTWDALDALVIKEIVETYKFLKQSFANEIL